MDILLITIWVNKQGKKIHLKNILKFPTILFLHQACVLSFSVMVFLLAWIWWCRSSNYSDWLLLPPSCCKVPRRAGSSTAASPSAYWIDLTPGVKWLGSFRLLNVIMKPCKTLKSSDSSYTYEGHTHTHLHLQSDPSSRRGFVLWRRQEATFPLLFVTGGTFCSRFTRTSTNLIYLHA